MAIGYLVLHLHLPGCTSLKEKRSRIKPILARLQREFNVSVAEIDRQDAWQEAVLAGAWVSSDGAQAQRSLQTVVQYVEENWPDEVILSQSITLL